MSGQHHMNSSCPLQCSWPCKQQGLAHIFSNILEHTAIQCLLDIGWQVDTKAKTFDTTCKKLLARSLRGMVFSTPANDPPLQSISMQRQPKQQLLKAVHMLHIKVLLYSMHAYILV